jgi:hypothetical protein
MMKGSCFPEYGTWKWHLSTKCGTRCRRPGREDLNGLPTVSKYACINLSMRGFTWHVHLNHCCARCTRVLLVSRVSTTNWVLFYIHTSCHHENLFTKIACYKPTLPYIKCNICILRYIPHVFMYTTTVFVVEIDHHDCDLWLWRWSICVIQKQVPDIMDECGNVGLKPRQMCRNWALE